MRRHPGTPQPPLIDSQPRASHVLTEHNVLCRPGVNDQTLLKHSAPFYVTAPHLERHHDGGISEAKRRTQKHILSLIFKATPEPPFAMSASERPWKHGRRHNCRSASTERLITGTQSTSPPQLWIKGVSICYHWANAIRVFRQRISNTLSPFHPEPPLYFLGDGLPQSGSQSSGARRGAEGNCLKPPPPSAVFTGNFLLISLHSRRQFLQTEGGTQRPRPRRVNNCYSRD